MLEERDRSARADELDAAYQRALHAELERRIDALATTSEEASGRLGPAEGLLVFVLFVLAPALAVWICR